MSEDGTTLTGELTGPIVNAERKAALLEEIAMKEGIPIKQVIAIGDGANDLLMLKKAGLGVAFNAKPIVQLEVSAGQAILPRESATDQIVTQGPITNQYEKFTGHSLRVWFYERGTRCSLERIVMKSLVT